MFTNYSKIRIDNKTGLEVSLNDGRKDGSDEKTNDLHRIDWLYNV